MRSLELCPSEGSRGRSWSTSSAGSSSPGASTCRNPSQRRAATDVTKEVSRSFQRTCRRRPLEQSTAKACESSDRSGTTSASHQPPTPQGTGQGTANATPSQTGKMTMMVHRCRRRRMRTMMRRRSPRRNGRRPQLLPLGLVAIERPLLDGLHLAELPELHLDGRHLSQLLGLQGASGSADATCSASRCTRNRTTSSSTTGRRGSRHQALLVLMLGGPPGQFLLRQEGHLLMLPGSDLLRGQSRRGDRAARSRDWRKRSRRCNCCRSCGSVRRSHVGTSTSSSRWWGGGSCTGRGRGRGQGQRLGSNAAWSDWHRRAVGAEQARPTGGHGWDPMWLK